MIFRNQRLYHTKGLKEGDYTVGFFNNEDNSFKSWMLEDTKQDIKIPGKTRIPAGMRELRVYKVDTPLTLKHRESYNRLIKGKDGKDWFKFHIEICDVPDFKYVYIHSGNDDSHTDGCNLPAYDLDIRKKEKPTLGSLEAVRDFYEICYPLLEKGIKCFIDIRDEIGY